jgi:hypothetical protein
VEFTQEHVEEAQLDALYFCCLACLYLLTRYPFGNWTHDRRCMNWAIWDLPSSYKCSRGSSIGWCNHRRSTTSNFGGLGWVRWNDVAWECLGACFWCWILPYERRPVAGVSYAFPARNNESVQRETLSFQLAVCARSLGMFHCLRIPIDAT